MRHLDDILYRQLVSGAPLSSEIRAHLAQPCEVCAGYLQGRTAVDALDGRVDAALLGNPPAGSAPPGELDAILSQVPQGGSRWHWALPAAGVAAALILGLGLSRVGSQTPLATSLTGIKGEAPLTVSTTLALVGPDGSVRPGSVGGGVHSADALALRLDLSRDAQISIVRIDATSAEIVLQNEPTPAGQRDLRKGGQLVGLPMQGLSGEQQVRVVAADRRLTPEEVTAAARGQPIEGAVVGGLSVRVAP